MASDRGRPEGPVTPVCDETTVIESSCSRPIATPSATSEPMTSIVESPVRFLNGVTTMRCGFNAPTRAALMHREPSGEQQQPHRDCRDEWFRVLPGHGASRHRSVDDVASPIVGTMASSALYTSAAVCGRSAGLLARQHMTSAASAGGIDGRSRSTGRATR